MANSEEIEIAQKTHHDRWKVDDIGTYHRGALSTWLWDGNDWVIWWRATSDNKVKIGHADSGEEAKKKAEEWFYRGFPNIDKRVDGRNYTCFVCDEDELEDALNKHGGRLVDAKFRGDDFGGSEWHVIMVRDKE